LSVEVPPVVIVVAVVGATIVAVSARLEENFVGVLDLGGFTVVGEVIVDLSPCE